MDFWPCKFIKTWKICWNDNCLSVLQIDIISSRKYCDYMSIASSEYSPTIIQNEWCSNLCKSVVRMGIRLEEYSYGLWQDWLWLPYSRTISYKTTFHAYLCKLLTLVTQITNASIFVPWPQRGSRGPKGMRSILWLVGQSVGWSVC